MRSADGLEACLVLSTACPNASSGRAAAAPAIAQLARKARRPLLVLDIDSSLLDLENIGPPALGRRRAIVNGSGPYERHLRFWRCRGIEYHFHRVAGVTVLRARGASGHEPHGHPRLVDDGRAGNLAQPVRPVAGSTTRSGILQLDLDGAHRRVAGAFLDVGVVRNVPLELPGLAVD